jgi:hypothetical protein
MMKARALAIFAVGALAAGAGVTGIASASAGGGEASDNPSTFTVFTHMTEAHVVSPRSTCAQPPLPTGSHVAAEYLHDSVFNAESGGQKIGEESFVISIVSSDAANAFLSGAVAFTGDGLSGQITVSGEIDTRSSSGVVAVTGGTGEFQGAKGEVSYSGAGPTSDVTTLVVHLIRH